MLNKNGNIIQIGLIVLTLVCILIILSIIMSSCKGLFGSGGTGTPQPVAVFVQPSPQPVYSPPSQPSSKPQPVFTTPSNPKPKNDQIKVSVTSFVAINNAKKSSEQVIKELKQAISKNKKIVVEKIYNELTTDVESEWNYIFNETNLNKYDNLTITTIK